MVITDQLMLDVLRSTSAVFGELCVMTTLTTTMHKLHALCSDLSEFVFACSVRVVVDFSASTSSVINPITLLLTRRNSRYLVPK